MAPPPRRSGGDGARGHGLSATALLLLCFLAVLALAQLSPAVAQASSPSTSPSASGAASPSASTTAQQPAYYTLTTSGVVTLTQAAGRPLPSGARPLDAAHTSEFLSTQARTLTLLLAPASAAASSTAPAAATASASAGGPSATAASAAAPGGLPASLPLHTVLDPAFGVLGGLLVLSGGFLALAGGRSSASAVVVSGFYSFALITLCVILRAGVASEVYDPSAGLRGVFLVACVVTGLIGGILALVFRYSAPALTASLGGLALGLLLQATRDGGLVRPLAPRYALYLACIALAFAAHLVPRAQRATAIAATALAGATALVLGVDCFTAAGLKEFYVRNLGFDDLFARKYPLVFSGGRFPLTTAMAIELAALGALALMAAAFQWRLYADIRRSLRALRDADEARDIARKAHRASQSIMRSASRDLAQWEKRYSSSTATATTLAPAPASAPSDADRERERERERKTSSAANSLLGYVPTRTMSGTPRSELSAAYAYGYAWDGAESKSGGSTPMLAPAPPAPVAVGAAGAAPPSPGSFLAYVSTGQKRDSGYVSRWDPAGAGLSRANSAATLPPLDLGAPTLGPAAATTTATSAAAMAGRAPSARSLRASVSGSGSGTGSEDPAAVLEEIQRIRKSIDDLRRAASVGSAAGFALASDSQAAAAAPRIARPASVMLDGRTRPAGAIAMSRTASGFSGRMSGGAGAQADALAEAEAEGDMVASIEDMRALRAGTGSYASTRLKRHSTGELLDYHHHHPRSPQLAGEVPPSQFQSQSQSRAHRLSTSSLPPSQQPQPPAQLQRTITQDPASAAARRLSALPPARPKMSEISPWTALPHRERSPSSSQLGGSSGSGSGGGGGGGSGGGNGGGSGPGTPYMAPLDRAQSQSRLSGGGNMTLAEYEARHKERLAAMQRSVTSAFLERESARKAAAAQAVPQVQVQGPPHQQQQQLQQSNRHKRTSMPADWALQRQATIDDIARQNVQHTSQGSLGGHAGMRRPQPTQHAEPGSRRHSTSDLLVAAQMGLAAQAPAQAQPHASPAGKCGSATLTETDRRRIAEGALQGPMMGGGGGTMRSAKRLSQPLLQFDDAVLTQALEQAAEEQRRHKRSSSGFTAGRQASA